MDVCTKLETVYAISSDEQQRAADEVNKLQESLNTLSTSDLVKVLGSILSHFEQSARHAVTCLELLSPCLTFLMTQTRTVDDLFQVGPEEGTSDKGASSQGPGPNSILVVPGSSHRDAAVHRICLAKWPSSHAAKVLEVLRDWPLSLDQVMQVMQKGFSMCHQVDLQHLPSLVYQLLLIAAAGHKQYVLKGIISLFDQLEGRHRNATGTAPSTILLQVEGTVLMYIAMAIKYDKDLGQEWLKYLKRSAVVSPTAFMWELMFSLCSNHQWEQTMMAVMKKGVLNMYQREAQAPQYFWLPKRESQGSHEGDPISPLLPSCCSSTMERNLLSCIHNSQCTGEMVVPAAVKLAVQFVTSCPAGSQAAADYALGLVVANKSGANKRMSVPVRAAALGIKMLESIFKVHAESRSEVLKYIQTPLLSGAPLEECLPFLLLLGNITQHHPSLLREHTERLKDCFLGFSSLNPEVALVVLISLWPLCQYRRDLRDYMVMVLRKVMFSRDVGGRLVAVRGFLYLILEQLRVVPGSLPESAQSMFSQASTSQVSLSQMPALSGGLGNNLLHELMGFLRKSLTQQSQVREALYEGVQQLLVVDPGTHECLVDLLLPHLLQYYEENEGLVVPIRMAQCVTLQGDEVRYLEPLPHLLSSVRALALVYPPGGLGSEVVEVQEEEGPVEDPVSRLRQAFESLKRRLVLCEAENFELDKGADLNPANPRGLYNQLRGGLLLGCLEVIMEDLVGGDTGPAHLGSPEEVNKAMSSAFELHQRVYELMRDAKTSHKKGTSSNTQTQAGQKRSRPALGVEYTPVDQRRPCMSPQCMGRLCDAVVQDGVMLEESEEVVMSTPDAGHGAVRYHQELVRDSRFQAFVLRSCLIYLDRCRAQAAVSNIMNNTGGGAASQQQWMGLVRALFLLCKTVLAAYKPCGGSSSKGSSRSTAQAEATDGLGMLAAKCVLTIIKLGESTQQLGPILDTFPLTSGAEAVESEDEGNAEGNAKADTTENLVRSRLPVFLELAEKLMQASAFKEAEVLTECLLLLGGHLSISHGLAISQWAERACEQEEPLVTVPSLCRSLLYLLVRFSGHDDIIHLKNVAEDIQKLVGDAAKETQLNTETQKEQVMPIINETTGQLCGAMVLNYCEEAMQQVDTLLTLMREVAQPPSGGEDSGWERAGGSQPGKLEQAACLRMSSLVQVMAISVNTMFGLPAILDHQVHALIKCYKLLSLIAKLHTPPKGVTTASLGKSFPALAMVVNRDLTPPLYNFLSDTQELAREQRGESFAKIKKEVKSIPQLVFCVEEWEKQLVTLSRLGKVNLMREAKRSTNRDFKLNISFPQGAPKAPQDQKPLPASGHEQEGDDQERPGEGDQEEDGEEGDDQEEEY